MPAREDTLDQAAVRTFPSLPHAANSGSARADMQALHESQVPADLEGRVLMAAHESIRRYRQPNPGEPSLNELLSGVNAGLAPPAHKGAATVRARRLGASGPRRGAHAAHLPDAPAVGVPTAVRASHPSQQSAPRLLPFQPGT